MARRQRRAVGAAAEQMALGQAGRCGVGHGARQRVVRVQRAVQEGVQLRKARAEVRWPGFVVQRLQRPGGQRQAAGRLAHAQVHAAGGQRCEHLERLGHLERAVVLQHHAARADADARGARQQVGHQHLGRRAGQARVAMVLGHPEAAVAQLLGALGQRYGALQRLGRRGPFGDGTFVEQGKGVGHGGGSDSRMGDQCDKFCGPTACTGCANFSYRYAARAAPPTAHAVGQGRCIVQLWGCCALPAEIWRTTRKP